MSANDGGFAFPVPGAARSDGLMLNDPEFGMTLRAYIATKALAALIGKDGKDPEKRGPKAIPLLAKYACEYADALIAEFATPSSTTGGGNADQT